MTRTETLRRLKNIAASIKVGSPAELDWAYGAVDELSRAYAPPRPTEPQLDQILAAMKAGNLSAAKIKGVTGIGTAVIYAGRWILYERDAIFQYDNGAGPTAWGCEP